MSSNSKIEWTDATWSPVVGCTKCSPGCLNCYAERMACRLAGMGAKGYNEGILTAKGQWTGNVKCLESALNKPLHWKKPRRIFVCSMSDLFHPKVPFEFIHKVFSVTQEAWWHKYLILTKRPKRLLEFTQTCARHDKYGQLIEPGTGKYYHYRMAWPHDNVHIGVSISNQAEADEKIPILLQIPAQIPATVRWLSIEPMLGGIKLKWNIVYPSQRCSAHIRNEPPPKGVDWVVVGCESGPKRRPFSLTWAQSIVKQCKVASVPVFVKQIIGNFGKVVKMPKGFPQEYPK